jgi:hypothetical protein
MPTLAGGMRRFYGEFNKPTASVGMAPDLPQQKHGNPRRQIGAFSSRSGLRGLLCLAQFVWTDFGSTAHFAQESVGTRGRALLARDAALPHA